MKKFCCVVLALLPLTAFAYPIDVQKDLNGMKIDYETLKHINPRLVYASISGFGQTGPWSRRPGLDLIAQASAGVMSVMGEPGAAPVKSSVPVADLGAGLFDRAEQEATVAL